MCCLFLAMRHYQVSLMYKEKLTVKETQKAIKILKDTFEMVFSNEFNLDRVSAPIMMNVADELNDDLGIKEKAVNFNVKSSNLNIEIVQSLAKWKRVKLKEYGYYVGEGIYADMNAIRPNDEITQIHSLYVDQWDWELIIEKWDRNLFFLKNVVKRIVDCLIKVEEILLGKYPQFSSKFSEKVYFVSAKELYELYPHLDEKGREDAIVRDKKVVFISGIGDEIAPGVFHGQRAFDYDDWQLNGDLLVWSDTLQQAVEITSMGIRVDDKALANQMLKVKYDKEPSKYHQQILNNKLPLTIGGGIGQSRICMLLLDKMHIAEVQASVWDEKTLEFFTKNDIKPL